MLTYLILTGKLKLFIQELKQGVQRGHISCTWAQCATTPFFTEQPRQLSLFFNQPENHKIGRGHWVLASCQVSSNFVQRFQKNSWKFLGQSEVRAAIMIFWSVRKTQIWKWILSSCLSSSGKFRSAVAEKRSKMSQPIRGGVAIWFLDRPENHKLGKGHWYLASYQRFSDEKSKMSQPIRGPDGLFGFRSVQKHKLNRGSC